MLTKCLVACNVYISAGVPHYAPILLKLLNDAQELCHRRKDDAIVVHAFSDASYDRSSFHIAGSPMAVASVASSLASQALESLSTTSHTKEQSSSSSSPPSSSPELAHPTVGLVDHISVLPLGDHNKLTPLTLAEWTALLETESSTTIKVLLESKDDLPVKCLPSGWVARIIGHTLEQSSLATDVLFYGHAHAKGKNLAAVRRESTQFFNSSKKATTPPPPTTTTTNQCTIGAPLEFVENFNIRLKSSCPKATAKALTRWVRERDGGLPFVEALTLPYSNNRYEVACNLLNPKVTSAQCITNRVEQFFQDKAKEDYDYLETCYRVGTTEEQCLQALKHASKSTIEGTISTYNHKIRKQLEAYLTV